MEFDKNLIKSATPIYTIIENSKSSINPYRELIHFVVNNVFPNLKEYHNVSLRDFAKLTVDKQREILKSAEAFGENLKVEFHEKTSHKKVFLEANYIQNNKVLCILKFYSFASYTKSDSDVEEDILNEKDIRYNVEIDFSMNDFLNFVNVFKHDNYFDFSKDDTNPLCIDMVLSFMKLFTDPTDYFKQHKATAITTNNIQMFADKLIRPYVTDMKIIYVPEHFLVGIICGTNIIKQTYEYDNYLASIKELAASIREKYGDTYKKDVQQNQ